MPLGLHRENLSFKGGHMMGNIGLFTSETHSSLQDCREDCAQQAIDYFTVCLSSV